MVDAHIRMVISRWRSSLVGLIDDFWHVSAPLYIRSKYLSPHRDGLALTQAALSAACIR
jgi:hypothetical protein